jgi:glyoxylase I family protein
MMNTETAFATETVQDTGSAAPPAVTTLHHLGITVTDLTRSVTWYREVLGMVPIMEEHYPGGRTVVLNRPGTAVDIGLDDHEDNEGERFAPHRTGLDHLSIAVPSRPELDTWHAHLTARGVECSPVRDIDGPMRFALVTFSDPDGVALELIHVADSV